MLTTLKVEFITIKAVGSGQKKFRICGFECVEKLSFTKQLISQKSQHESGSRRH